MTSNSKQTATREVTAAIRGRMVSLTVLELFGSDLGELNSQLREKTARAPAFFRHAPLLLDFEHFDAEVDITWLDSAYRLLTNNYFVPVGITGASQSLEDAARTLGIAIWPSGGAVRQAAEPEQPKPEQPKPEKPQAVTTAAPVHSATQVLHQPVRSGQRVYAQGGDLIVLASVSTGAEILADGHIHVYGTLRGRALAGVQGNESARIFCHDLQADLVAIAGYYIISDDLPADKRNTAVQIFLHQEQLQIESL
ncbi:MAG: septum site-determining protein MinC [Desulforhopalus sp.]|nr:septum site-determining protein MinC [Desulforhopalus sp.]